MEPIHCRLLPQPLATQESASSAMEQAICVRSAMSLSKPYSRLPPPVSTMPFCAISATSSGDECSSTSSTSSTICRAGRLKASSISIDETATSFGRPVLASRPLMSIETSCGRSYTQPMVILTSSAVLRPMSIP